MLGMNNQLQKMLAVERSRGSDGGTDGRTDGAGDDNTLRARWAEGKNGLLFGVNCLK